MKKFSAASTPDQQSTRGWNKRDLLSRCVEEGFLKKEDRVPASPLRGLPTKAKQPAKAAAAREEACLQEPSILADAIPASLSQEHAQQQEAQGIASKASTPLPISPISADRSVVLSESEPAAAEPGLGVAQATISPRQQRTPRPSPASRRSGGSMFLYKTEKSPREESQEKFRRLLNEHYQKIEALLGNKSVLQLLQAKNEALRPEEEEVLQKFYAQFPLVAGKNIQEVLRFTVLLAVALPRGKGGHPTFIEATEYHEKVFSIEQTLASFLIQSLRTSEEAVLRANQAMEALGLEITALQTAHEQHLAQLRLALETQAAQSATEKAAATDRITALEMQMASAAAEHAAKLQILQQAHEGKILVLQNEHAAALQQKEAENLSLTFQLAEVQEQSNAFYASMVTLQEHVAAQAVESEQGLARQLRELEQVQGSLDEVQKELTSLKAAHMTELTESREALVQVQQQIDARQQEDVRRQQSEMQAFLGQLDIDWAKIKQDRKVLKEQLEILVAGFCGLMQTTGDAQHAGDHARLAAALTSILEKLDPLVETAERELEIFRQLVDENAQEENQVSFPSRIMQARHAAAASAIKKVDAIIKRARESASLEDSRERLQQEKLKLAAKEQAEIERREAERLDRETAKQSIIARLDRFAEEAGIAEISSCLFSRSSIFQCMSKGQIVSLIKAITKLLGQTAIETNQLGTLVLLLDKEVQRHGLIEVFEHCLFKNALKAQTYGTSVHEMTLAQAMQILKIDFKNIWEEVQRNRPLGKDTQERNFYALRMGGMLR
ncbi:MAG: hypothetical protein K0S08_520 [Gammaproteobacteria bacterium]|jgi:hypothetical protein|nr:hypothetical protein [Gammaproteobacteria bacterium]